MVNVRLRGTAMRVGLERRRRENSPAACSDQPGIAVFVEDDVPFGALECVEGEVYLVDGEIGDPAGAEDDDLISVISAAAGWSVMPQSMGSSLFSSRWWSQSA